MYNTDIELLSNVVNCFVMRLFNIAVQHGNFAQINDYLQWSFRNMYSIVAFFLFISLNRIDTIKNKH